MPERRIGRLAAISQILLRPANDEMIIIIEEWKSALARKSACAVASSPKVCATSCSRQRLAGPPSSPPRDENIAWYLHWVVSVGSLRKSAPRGRARVPIFAKGKRADERTNERTNEDGKERARQLQIEPMKTWKSAQLCQARGAARLRRTIRARKDTIFAQIKRGLV